MVERKSLHAALDRAAIRDGEAVLEVAVGTGVVFREILRRNPSGRNAGIDLTEAMLRRARKKAAGSGVPFELTIGDARAMACADASFDVAVCNNLLGLVGEPHVAAIVAELHRVLRPGGRLVCVTMKRPRTALAAWAYQNSAVRLGGWRDVQPEPHVRMAGFVDVERRDVVQIGIPSEVLTARRPPS